MSGYPLRTAYDATETRKKYLESLALRAKLDNDNLQANKLYKRTGAVATPPDTRTTTEKLADLFRVRIDIRSKLGQLMSGDDAQAVVNRLDEQELVFLSGRIDKMIADLKPKYTLGMPYQVFMSFFQDAVKNFMAYGDVEISRAILEELASTSADTQFAIENLTRQIQLQGKQELIFNMDNIRQLLDLVGRGQQLLDGFAIDPQIENQVQSSIDAIKQAVPTKKQLLQIEDDFQKAVRLGDNKQQKVIADELTTILTNVDTLKNNIDELSKVVEDVTGQLPVAPPPSLKRDTTQDVVKTYIKPFNPSRSYYNVDMANNLFTKMFEIIENNPQKKQIWDNIRQRASPVKGVEGGLKITDNIKSGNSLYQHISKKGYKFMGIRGVNTFIDDFKNEFEDIFTEEARTIPAPADPFSRTDITDYRTFTTQPPAPAPAPKPKKKVGIFQFMFKKPNFKQLVEQITNEDASYTEDILKNDINNMTIDPIFNVYSMEDNNDKALIISYVEEYVTDLLNELAGGNAPALDFTNFVREKQQKSATGKGLRKKSKSCRMKGGSVKIDTSVGIPQQEKPANYVPFGRYILNRNKLNDGVVMIKRPNGAFMGDLQSRRISSNLKNIFQKVIGGNIPNYQDFSKLDDDEKEYLHYVAKKTNLVDKLQVPAPKKDSEEKMIDRFQVLRGQIVAGNDNRQLINEFKKLVLQMSDLKLLPRRQVSDILIDIERAFGN